MRRMFLAVLCLTVTAAAAAQAQTTWFRFEDPDKGFTAEFSGTPSVKHSTTKGADGGDVITTTYDLQRDTYELTIADTDLARFHADAGHAIDIGVTGTKNLLANVLSDAIVTQDGQVGREVTGEDKDGLRFDNRIFFVAGHLYQVLTVLPKEAKPEGTDSTKHFQDTFHFVQ